MSAFGFRHKRFEPIYDWLIFKQSSGHCDKVGAASQCLQLTCARIFARCFSVVLLNQIIFVSFQIFSHGHLRMVDYSILTQGVTASI